MFTFKNPNETGLTDEEKKMAEELNEAIETHQRDEEDDLFDEFDDLEEKHELSPTGRLAYNIADHLAEVTAERFSEMIDGMEMDTAKQIVRRLQVSDAEGLVGMLQEMFLVKGMVHAAEELDILSECEEFEGSIYWRFQDVLADQAVFEWFRIECMIDNCYKEDCSSVIRMSVEVS